MLEDRAGQKDQTFYWDGNVAAMEEAGQDSYYLQDDLGSPMQLLDEKGGIRESYGYDEFGRSLYDYPEEQMQPFGYTGYQVEAAGELYFAQARRYDAGTGRFAGRDKDRYLRFNKPNSLNQYIYCENNPITYIDPRGNSLEDRYSTNPGKNDPVQVKISGNTITIDAYVDITGDINTAVGNYTAHDLVIEGIEKWAGTYPDVFGHTVTVNVNVHERHKSRGSEPSEVSDQNYITINLFDGSDRAYTLYNIPWNTSDPGEINMFTEYSNDGGGER